MVPNCSPGLEVSIDIKHDLPRSNFEVDLSRSLSTILYVVASGDLNIALTQTSVNKSCRSANELSNAVCGLSLRFVVSRSEGGLKKNA